MRKSSAGAEAVDLAATCGLILDPWQVWWLDQALSERKDGDWCARETVLITARQSGKNAVLAALELAALDLFGDPMVIHSAHEVPTALNHFKFVLGLVQNTPDLDRKVKRISYTNGKESIEWHNGSMLQFRARGVNSGRGLTAGRLVFDEAFKIPPESMGALIPTLRAMKNTQITYASSAPKHDSVVLQSLIKRGQLGDPEDRLFYADWGNPPGTAMDDIDAWYRANPALGIRIDESALRDEYRTLVVGGDETLIAEFSREAVGIGEEPRTAASKPVKIPELEWFRTITDRPPELLPGEIVLSFDVTRDGRWASVAVGAGSMKDAYVEVIEHREGVGWLPDRLCELVQKWSPQVVGVNGAGPAGAQVGPVLQAFYEAGIPATLLHQVPMNDYKQACGGFFSAILEGTLQRPAGQGPLDAAAGDASERPLGDAWAWDLRTPTCPISPLVACTIARAVLPTERPVIRPVFAF
jgi:hypothetical protein